MAGKYRRRVVRRRRVFKRRGVRRSSRRVVSRRRGVGKRITRGFLGAAANARYLDSVVSPQPCNTTGSTVQIDAVPTGTSVNSREGKAFSIDSVEIRGTIASDTSTVFATGRVHLVWDEQPNKTLAGIADIFDSGNSNSLIKRENIGRFRILGSWVYTLQGSGTTVVTDAACFVVDKHVRTPGCIACCTSADLLGLYSSRITGCMLLCTQGDQAAGFTDCSLNVNVRVNFSDIRS